MKFDAVIGANYGDEGKGLVTNYLSLKNKECKGLIILNNGGAQRGHTVETVDGFRHVFKHFGSTVNPNYKSYCSEYFIVNPCLWNQERIELQKKGLTPELIVHPSCKVSTVFDMMLNQMLELSRGEERHGSVGVGIWETICRDKKIPIKFSISSSELFGYSLKEKIIKYFKDKVNEYNISEKVKQQFELNTLDLDGLYGHWAYDFMQMKNICRTEDKFGNYEFEHVIFENGQGLLLDQSTSMIHSTPSYTGTTNILYMYQRQLFPHIRLPDFTLNTYYVSRCYLTRHGAGDLPFECDPTNLLSAYEPDLTNQPNDYQGTLRYAKLDCKSLGKRIYDDFKFLKEYIKFADLNVVFTHVNEVDYNYIDLYNELKRNIPYYYKNTFISNSKYQESIVQL